MKLRPYLRAIGESGRQFSIRSGVGPQTVYDVMSGVGCSMFTAYLIVMASRERPASGDRTVEYEDLVLDDAREFRRDYVKTLSAASKSRGGRACLSRRATA